MRMQLCKTKFQKSCILLAKNWIKCFPWNNPLIIQIAQMGLILHRWGIILPRIPPPTSVLYSALTNPFWGYVWTQNTHSPTQKHPFSWPDFESGQNELLSGQNGPQLGKMFQLIYKEFKLHTRLGVRVEKPLLLTLVFKYFGQLMGQADFDRLLWLWSEAQQ